MGTGPRGLHPLEIYDYMVEARARVLRRVGQLTLQQYAAPFPFGRRTIRETLYHVVETEWWYNRLLRGEPAEVQRIDFNLLTWDWYKKEKAASARR